MTKAELAETVFEVIGPPHHEAGLVVETIFNSIVRALRAGEKVEVRGFGSFRTRQRRARIGRNPKTGTRVDVPAKKIVYFTPGRRLMAWINPEAGSL